MHSLYDKEAIRNEFARLKDAEASAYAALICERFEPYYAPFHQESQWGDPLVLETALKEIWDHVEGTIMMSSERMDTLISLLVDQHPHSEQHGSTKAVLAGFSCNFLISTIELLKEEDRAHLVSLAVMARNYANQISPQRINWLEKNEAGEYIYTNDRMYEILSTYPAMIKEVQFHEKAISILADDTRELSERIVKAKSLLEK